MKRLEKIIVPTDLTEGSRRAIEYAAWLAAENKGELLVMHVANEFAAWEIYEDAFGYAAATWPLDRVFAEAQTELNRFLESHSDLLRRVPVLSKYIFLGTVADEIVYLAQDKKADLIVLSPRGRRRWRWPLTAGVSERVARMAPCPVLSVAPPIASEQWRGKSLPVVLGWQRPSAENI
jgi:nucleotide-binding universal stress UspA family protein